MGDYTLSNLKRITIFAGHYGSGKTNIAINYALYLKSIYDNVTIADIDIVNPYFRTKDGEKVLSENGIKLISSEYANTNVDVPAIPPEVYAVTQNKELYSVIDVGGDDRGAYALGRYAPDILKENNYNMYFVINKYRPLTKDASGTVEIMKEIEASCGIKFNGIVNNSNLGNETTATDILDSVKYADEISKASGLDVVLTTVRSDLFNEVSQKIDNAFPIKIYVNFLDRIKN